MHERRGAVGTGNRRAAYFRSWRCERRSRYCASKASARHTANWFWSTAAGWARTSLHFLKMRSCSGALMLAKEASTPPVPTPAVPDSSAGARPNASDAANTGAHTVGPGPVSIANRSDAVR